MNDRLKKQVEFMLELDKMKNLYRQTYVLHEDRKENDAEHSENCKMPAMFRDADFVLDMGEAKTFSTVTTDFLQQLGAWVLLPKSISYSYSMDNKTFTDMGRIDFAEDKDIQVKFIPGTVTAAQPVTARYVRVKIETIGVCPPWHYGVGYPAWFFIDEVVVE